MAIFENFSKPLSEGTEVLPALDGYWACVSAFKGKPLEKLLIFGGQQALASGG